MPILENIATLVTCGGEGGQADVHPVDDAALAWEGDTISWVGPSGELPARFDAEERHDAGGALVVPGLVDCHTHLAFGGWRADEFEMRCRGASYLEVARAGGGILATVRATREATEAALMARAGGFLREMAALGVTTVECKSGYGLNIEDELKTLRVYQRLRERQPVGLVSTFLGAHVVPPEFEEARGDYLDLLCDELIPLVAAAGLAEFCDVFVEEGAFSTGEAREVLEAATGVGLRPKLHADQLHDGGGAHLAAAVGAISADHLEYAADEGIRAMAAAGTVAVALPLATLYLGQRPFDGRRFVEAGVDVAVATDFNPGTAPSYQLPLAMTLACATSGLTPAEALKGATYYAARALGREDDIGSLEPGKQADFVLVDSPDVNHWLYHVRPNAVRATYAAGTRIYAGPESSTRDR